MQISVEAGATASSQPARQRVASVQEGLRALGLLVMPFQFVVSLGPIIGQLSRLPTLARVGLVLLCLSQMLTTVVLARRWYSLRAWLLQAVTLFSAHLLLTTGRMDLVPRDLWGPGYWASPLVVVTIMLAPSRLRRRLLTLLITLVLGIEAVSVAVWWPLAAPRVADEIFVVYPMLIILTFSLGLTNMAQEHDEAARRAEQARQRQQRQRLETEARREAARLLHDHVLHALHALAAERSHVSDADAAQECRDAVRMIDQPTDEGVLLSLDELLAQDPATQRVHAQIHGSTERLPRAVATALAAATHEALVNVERHAAAKNCSIRLESFGSEGCRVTITDDGCGFDPASRRPHRLGLQASVVERLDDIGGQARITSKPGAGTQVALQWPRSQNSPSPSEPPAARSFKAPASDPRTRRMMVATALPALVACALVMALVGPGTPHFALLGPTTSFALLVGAWCGWRLLEQELNHAELVLLLGSAAGAWVLNLVLVPDDPLDIYHLWMSWGATGLVQLAMLARPSRQAAILGGVFSLVTVVGTLLRFGLHDSVMIVGGGTVIGVVVVVTGHHALAFAHALSASKARQTHQRQRTLDATARMHHSARVEQFWSDRVTQEVLPLIRRVADGTVTAHDPRVRAAALTMESSVRDELVLGPDHQGLGACIAQLRNQGWQVSSTLNSEDPPEVRLAASQIARLLGKPARLGQVVTLSGSRHEAAAVVLEASQAQLAEWSRRVMSLGGSLHNDPDFVRMAVTAP
ncbi:sensor histidine kinase [Luteococcus sp. OSA5]|uniref:sensor histidine kinase n=1 Tax=Luteococcus sp. OSA5 TaxID=3401630 RepID=UPI003B431AD5